MLDRKLMLVALAFPALGFAQDTAASGAGFRSMVTDVVRQSGLPKPATATQSSVSGGSDTGAETRGDADTEQAVGATAQREPATPPPLDEPDRLEQSRVIRPPPANDARESLERQLSGFADVSRLDEMAAEKERETREARHGAGRAIEDALVRSTVSSTVSSASSLVPEVDRSLSAFSGAVETDYVSAPGAEGSPFMAGFVSLPTIATMEVVAAPTERTYKPKTAGARPTVFTKEETGVAKASSDEKNEKPFSKFDKLIALTSETASPTTSEKSGSGADTKALVDGKLIGGKAKPTWFKKTMLRTGRVARKIFASVDDKISRADLGFKRPKLVATLANLWSTPALFGTSEEDEDYTAILAGFAVWLSGLGAWLAFFFMLWRGRRRKKV